MTQFLMLTVYHQFRLQVLLNRPIKKRHFDQIISHLSIKLLPIKIDLKQHHIIEGNHFQQFSQPMVRQFFACFEAEVAHDFVGFERLA